MDVETPVIGGGRANVDEFKGGVVIHTLNDER
jgi:hypothetical protein